MTNKDILEVYSIEISKIIYKENDLHRVEHFLHHKKQLRDLADKKLAPGGPKKK